MVRQLVPLPPYDEESGVDRIIGPYYHLGVHRFQVVVVYKSGKRSTKNYARFKMEKFLGKQLPKDMEVHHKNENTLNDKIWNLEILSKSVHTILHNTIYSDKETICLLCGKIFKISPEIQTLMLCDKRRGKFCGFSCAAKSQWIKYSDEICKNKEIRKQKYGY